MKEWKAGVFPDEILVDFYKIQWFSRYVIDKHGQVYDKKMQRLMEASYSADYRKYTLMRDDGVWVIWRRHRLMMYVFDHPGIGIDDLEVNHIDSVKHHDWLENLEWTTGMGNIQHSVKSGTFAAGRLFSVRDVDTGEVVKHTSIVRYAKTLGFRKESLLYRLWVGEKRVFPERKQYRDGHGDEPWYIPEDIDLHLLENGTNVVCDLRDVTTGEVIRFQRTADAAAYIGVRIARLTPVLKRTDQPVIYGKYQLKAATDTTPWRPVDDPLLDIDRQAGASSKGAQRIVVVKHEATGEIKTYRSAKDCANDRGILTTTLNWRLKNAGKNVYSDGYRYMYYSDYKLSAQGEILE